MLLQQVAASSVTIETLSVISDLLRVATLALVGVVGWILKGALRTLEKVEEKIEKHNGRIAAVEARVDEHHRMPH